MFGLKLSVRGHQHVFQLEIPELQAFHGKIELGPEIIIMAHSCVNYVMTNVCRRRSKASKQASLLMFDVDELK